MPQVTMLNSNTSAGERSFPVPIRAPLFVSMPFGLRHQENLPRTLTAFHEAVGVGGLGERIATADYEAYLPASQQLQNGLGGGPQRRGSQAPVAACAVPQHRAIQSVEIGGARHARLTARLAEDDQAAERGEAGHTGRKRRPGHG